ncbi:MAG: hypothetical protein MUO34_13755, partial [Ignavibacteriaceae bacterium]|nr:hypothetical protein [Ignavibacteriaceae bacterium]
ILVFTFTSCDDTITVDDVDDNIIPDSLVSYSEHIVPVLQVKCYSCHGNGRYEAGLDLTLYTNIVDGRIVVKYEPETSVLIWKVEGRAGIGLPMPPLGTAPALTENQLKGFWTWIDKGAEDN